MIGFALTTYNVGNVVLYQLSYTRRTSQVHQVYRLTNRCQIPVFMGFGRTRVSTMIPPQRCALTIGVRSTLPDYEKRAVRLKPLSGINRQRVELLAGIQDDNSGNVVLFLRWPNQQITCNRIPCAARCQSYWLLSSCSEVIAWQH